MSETLTLARPYARAAFASAQAGGALAEWSRKIVAHNPSCSALTNGCLACWGDGESFECSTPGIACIVTEWSCSDKPRPVSVPPASGTGNTPSPAAK